MNLDKFLNRSQKQLIVQAALKAHVDCEFSLRYDGTFGRDWKVSGGDPRPRVVFSVPVGDERFHKAIKSCAKAIKEMYVGSTHAVALMGGKE